jgi:ACS family glucarate transporter-like MFS transporter
MEGAMLDEQTAAQFRRGWIGLFLFTLTMINYIDRIALSFAAKPIAAEFHLSPVALGYLFSSFLWTYTAFLIPSGVAVDRLGTKRVAAFGISLWSLSTALTGAVWSFPALLVTRLGMGAGEATNNPVGARVIREWIPAGERGILSAIFNSGAYAGPALCAVAVGTIINAFDWRGLFICAGSIGFIWLAAWLRWFRRPEDAVWLGEAERRKILAERKAETSQLDGRSEGHGLFALLRTRTMWGLALTQGCTTYAQYLFLTWIPSYLQTTKKLTILKTGLFTAVPYALTAVLMIVIGRFSDRLLKKQGVASGRRRNVIACVLMAASIILFAPFVDNIWLLLGLMTISLTGIASSTSMNFALLNDMLPNPRDIGKGMSFLIVGGNTFGLMAPIVTGYVIAVTGGYTWAFAIAGVLLVGGATATLTMTRRPMIIQPGGSYASNSR